MIVVGFSYILLTKKYLKPIFNGIELKKEKASKFFYYWSPYYSWIIWQSCLWYSKNIKYLFVWLIHSKSIIKI